MKKGLLIILCFAFNYLQAQHCATMEVLKKHLMQNPNADAALKNLDLISAKDNSALGNKKSRAIVTIPVVVHVLTNNEPLGTGPNILDTQIKSQIVALNEDFRLKNSDSLKTNHPYWPYTADCEIQFVLAKRKPDGTATTGIVRWNIGATSYDINDLETTIKPQTIWNRNQYLNMWVGNFDEQVNGGRVLGYAQFPGQGSANTDGVAFWYKCFGFVGNVQAPNDNGRTAVHEVGHWLGLRHIWGDATCGDDFVNDTPPAENNNSGCPSFPHNVGACSSLQTGEMYMNYMDYVNDNCMVMFTLGQKNRMWSTLNGTRSSIKTSPGALNPWPTSITNSLLASDIAIAPNPAIDKFEIVFSNNVEGTIKITNIQGQLVKSQAINSNKYITINTQNWPSGMYFVNIVDEVNTFNITKKIWVNK